MTTQVTRKDRQYMDLCKSMAEIFSTCGKKKYSAVLLDRYGHIVGIGYNGGPSGLAHCVDGGCPRYIDNSPSGSNYDNCIAVHAEANALLHSNYSSSAKKLYVNGPPCFSCAKLIANSTVEEVVYISSNEYNDWDNVKKFLNSCGIKLKEVI
jgi:dCMP deaminase